MTLYEALISFKDIYDKAINNKSKRALEIISNNWQSINNEMDCYYNAVATGDSVGANLHIQNIVDILNGYDLTIDLPIPLPISLSVYGSPSSILVPVDENGNNPDFTNAISKIFVYIGGVDDTNNWVYSIASENNATGVIQNVNEVLFTSLTADAGSLTVNIARDGYTTLSFTVFVNRSYAPTDGIDGLSIDTYPSSILIPADSDGSNPVYTNAISIIKIREGGVDETSNWAFAIQTQTNVTATIENNDEVTISNITADEGLVVVRASRSGYTNQDFEVPVQMQKKGETVPGTGGTVQDAVTLAIQPDDEGLLVGNARGANSVDLQTVRSAVDMVASGTNCVIAGGESNKCDFTYNFIGGGSANQFADGLSSGRTCDHSVIGGGVGNSVMSTGGSLTNANCNVIGGGSYNNMYGGNYNFIGGGLSNHLDENNNYAVICGGVGNNIFDSNWYSVISGGRNNDIYSAASVIGGGEYHNVYGDFGTISGGRSNDVSGNYGAIPGGMNNRSNTYSECVVGLYSEDIAGNGTDITDTDPVFRVGNGTNEIARSDALKILKNGGVFMAGLKSGTSQANAGAGVSEIWIDTNDNSLKMGI